MGNSAHYVLWNGFSPQITLNLDSLVILTKKLVPTCVVVTEVAAFVFDFVPGLLW